MRLLVIPTYAEICLRLSCTQITPEELKILAIAFNEGQDAEVQAKGLVISGKKYFTILIDKDSIQLKQKVSPGPISPPNSISIAALFRLSV